MPRPAEPASVEPALVEPALVDPMTAEPATVEPALAESATVEPALVEPETRIDAIGSLTPASETTSHETTIMGALSKEEIRPVIQQQNGRARYCYERQLMRTPELEGRLVIRFVITRTGTVSAVTITQSLHTEVDECIAAMVRGLQFPAPRGGGIVVVNYPFDFVTSD